MWVDGGSRFNRMAQLVDCFFDMELMFSFLVFLPDVTCRDSR
jgi:hypothetical protein